MSDLFLTVPTLLVCLNRRTGAFVVICVTISTEFVCCEPYNLERIIIVFLIDIAFIIIVFIIINIIIIISSYQFIVTDFSIPPLGPVPCDCSISCPLHHLERTDDKHSLGIWDVDM